VHLVPLILALGDALARSEELLKRAEGREWKGGDATGTPNAEMHERFGGGARNTGYVEDEQRTGVVDTR